MRAIDADKLKKYIDDQEGRPFSGVTIGEALKIMVDEQPAIEPKKGKWIFKEDFRIVDGYDWKCDQCGSWQRYTSNYCPNCGARMEGRDD